MAPPARSLPAVPVPAAGWNTLATTKTSTAATPESAPARTPALSALLSTAIMLATVATGRSFELVFEYRGGLEQPGRTVVGAGGRARRPPRGCSRGRRRRRAGVLPQARALRTTGDRSWNR